MATIAFTYSGGAQVAVVEINPGGFGTPALETDDLVALVIDALNAYSPTDLTVTHAEKTVCTEVELYP